MNNLQYIVAILFEKMRYPQIVDIASNKEVFKQLMDLLNTYPDNRSIIVNIEEGHFKFWLYEELGRQIRYVWGRIGGTASVKDISESKYDAIEKRLQKIRKGYQQLI